MAIETAQIGRSRGLAGLGSLPAFELPAVDGGTVRSWDYRNREHLVLTLAGREPDLTLLEALARREGDVCAEDAAILVVMRTEADEARARWERGGRPGRALADADGRVHARLDTDTRSSADDTAGAEHAAGAERATGTEHAAGTEPELLVVDRDGTIYWRAALSKASPERLVDEALSWLQYMNILEHECGTCVPAWPDEDLP